MKNNLFKELLESIKEARVMKEIEEHRKVKKEFDSIYDQKMKNPKFKKLLEEGYKEMAKEEGILLESSTDIDELTNSPYTFKYNIFEYIEIYWRRYVWNYVEDAIRYIKRFFQRGKNGWAVCDTWGLDFYIAKVISESLQHLLDNGNSAWTKKDLKALKEIVYTFKTAKDIISHNVRYIPSDKFTWKEYKKYKKFCKMMSKKYNDNYRIMTKRESIRFEKGFSLFQKYYFHLWD